MSAFSILQFAFLAILVCSVEGRFTYQKKIPNGDKIPHPCKANTIWSGVGHLNQIGGGKRNPFGQAFQSANFKWTKALCEADSDGDGKKNGEELGDPNCVWQEGLAPAKTSGLSHPGICEPVDSAKCSSQQWISCSGTKANCSARTEAGIRTIDVRFPRTKVPAQLTTYYCKTFLLPHDQDYHIVATEPVLDNTKVIHHMLLYGCEGDMSIEDNSFKCMMASAKCNNILAGWTVGQEGKCGPKQAGMRFGKSIYKYVQLQVHWTNDAKATDWYDSSGIKLFYTPKLRKYDLAIVTAGQFHLELPPGKPKVVAQGICEPHCTRKMLSGTDGVNVTSATLHAHYLGRNMSLAQYRNGKFLRYLAKDDVFSYNNPTSKVFDPPVLLLPGDQLRTTCIYDTTSRKETTYYGDGTFDEMCFGFINYYPKLKMKQTFLCASYERYSFCDVHVFRNASFYKHNFGTCNFTDFENKAYIPNVVRACGENQKTCSKGCKFYVDEMNKHRCMKGYEQKMYKNMMQRKVNGTATVVWNARKTCAESKNFGSDAAHFTAIPAYLAALLFIALRCTMN